MTGRSGFRRLVRWSFLAILWVATGLGLRTHLQAGLLRDFDREIRSGASGLAKRCVGPDGTLRLPGADSGSPSHDHREQTYWEVREGRAAVLAASRDLQGYRFPDADPGSLPRESWYHCLYLHKMRLSSVPLALPAQPERKLSVHFARDYRGWKEDRIALDRYLAGCWAAILGAALGAALWRRRAKGLPFLPASPVPSIVLRLQIGLFAVSTAVLGLAGWGTYALIEHGWTRQMDQALESRARGVAALCEKIDGKWSFDGSDVDTSVFNDPKSMQYFQVWDGNGRQLGKSSSLAHLSFPLPDLDEDEIAFGWFHPTFLHRTRYVAMVVGSGRDALVVCFGQDYRGMKARLRQVRGILFAIWGASTLLLSLLLWLIARFSLAPLHRLASAVARLEPGHLRELPNDEPVPTEVRPLVDALGASLGRLEDAFRRERALISNLAHELRTPIAGLRTVLEVGIVDDEAHARRAMASGVEIAIQMQGIVEALLSLSRLDSGQETARIETAALGPALDAALESARRPEGNGAPEIRAELLPGVAVTADPRWLGIVLRNLVDNAWRHAGPDGRIAIESRREGGEVVLAMANGGCDLDPAELPRVFERFWRKSASRTVGAGHAGLGLSICRELSERMAGRLSASIPEPGIFRIELRLPAAS